MNFIVKIKSFYLDLRIFLKKHPLIITLLVFGFFLLFFLFLYMNLPVVSSADDHFFHFRFAEQIRENGFLNSFQDFQTLPFTKIAQGQHFLYYNFLFYLVLIPLSFITPLFLGIKLFAVVFLALIGTILYLFFRKNQIKYSFLWSLGFFIALGIGTLWRLFLSRPFVFSPLIILLLILALHKKKYLWVFLLSFIYLFWHTATFLVPLGVILIYFISYAFYERKYLWKEILLVLGGVLTSLLVVWLINKGFWIHIQDNLLGVLDNVLGFSGNKEFIQMGNEVYPKNFFDLLEGNRFLIFLFVFSILFFVFSFFKDFRKEDKNAKKDKKVLTLFFFFLATFFWVLIPVISNRFTDFFIFFSWIFVVLVLDEFFTFIVFNLEYNKIFFKRIIFICLIFFLVNTFVQLKTRLSANGNDPENFRVVGEYLVKNLKRYEVVFNVDWGSFPQLYYYAPKLSYVIGLEPKLMYLNNPNLYRLWANIQKGYICDQIECLAEDQRLRQVLKDKNLEKVWYQEQGDKIANIIKNDFKSSYIVSSRNFLLLNNVLDNNKHFEKVVNDQDYLFVYKILP